MTKFSNILSTNPSIRVNILLTTLNVSQKDIARQLDISQPTISAMVSGRRGVGTKFLKRLKEVYPQINTEWILTGHGEMFIGPDDNPPIASVQPVIRNTEQTNVTFGESDFYEIVKQKDEQIQWLQSTIDNLIRTFQSSLGKLNPSDLPMYTEGVQFGGRMAA